MGEREGEKTRSDKLLYEEKEEEREREKTHIITIAERTNGGYQTVEDSPSMLCPVDIKIKTSSHRERLVVRELWEQSRRRRRGDLQSQRSGSQRRMPRSKRDTEKTEKTDAALPVYFTTPNGERGMGGMGGEVMKKI